MHGRTRPAQRTYVQQLRQQAGDFVLLGLDEVLCGRHAGAANGHLSEHLQRALNICDARSPCARAWIDTFYPDRSIGCFQQRTEERPVTKERAHAPAGAERQLHYAC